MKACLSIVLAVAALLVAASSAPAATKWLCGPGVKDDPCRPRLTTTLFEDWATPVGGSAARRHGDRGVACFYVYPTVSGQDRRLATKRIDPELRSTALFQAARYSEVCQVYAPVYRQATLTSLTAGTTTRGDYRKAYRDVEEAFDAFLRRIGRERGFVLIGHSQGSAHLERLIRRRIEDRAPLRRRLVSALLPGGDVTVRRGSDRGGTFRRIPTCERASQLACVIAFSVFNETPPESALFGRDADPDLEVACTNPAALGSGRSRPLSSIVPAEPFAPGTLVAAGIGILGLEIPAADSTFVQADGAFSGRCSRAGGAHVLRIESAPGSPVPKPSLTRDWGLHLVDANVALGDLLGIVRRQIRAFRT